MHETQTIHLQAVGRVPAVPADDLKPGDQIMYNYGSVSQVVKIVDASPKFFKIHEVSAETGTESVLRVKKTTMVARVPEKHRRPLGHTDVPANHYRAQVQAPTASGLGWITVSHGETVEAATNGITASGATRSYFGTVMLDDHGLGYAADSPEGRANSVKAMAEGAVLTAADGHSFRILRPSQPDPTVAPTLTEALTIRPKQLTNLTPVEVDRYNAVVADELSRLAGEADKAADGVHRALLQRKVSKRQGRGYSEVWPTTLAEAERIARQHLDSGYTPDQMARVQAGLTAPGAYTKRLRAAVGHLESTRMQTRIIMDGPLVILDEEFRRRGGWSRMYLCTSDGGHVHTGRDCPSIGLRTPLKWIPEVSGMEWREAYRLVIKGATAGTEAIMCTKCYPDAPTEWTERQVPETECPGSRTNAYDYMTEKERRLYSKRGTCPECGQGVSVTSAWKFRKHDRPQ
ncbi:hypothetical protein [Streptomyces sp. MH60]|uniref:hypothetical protein n=1 Tax=Streptomyces sp. MH60 TaxID=1940758 RepID=UPI000CEE96BE|nr:hypothetical protein [Streptomyces sp. MH60]PPS89582.1 hypothetical protein BZZ08_01729 [Streptomyces sp. MH60]